MMHRSNTDNASSAGQGPQILRVVDLGRMAYAAAFVEQQRINQAVIDQASPATLLLVEHDPVITVTPRKGAAEHVLASTQRLAELGVAVEPTNRGGDVTYHGPGQLVAYPIVRLGDFGLNLGRYMRLLEEIVIATLGGFGITAHREPGATGVWVQGRGDPSPPGEPSRAVKICAMGVRVRRNVTMHGLALNVAPDMSHFELIVPCGLAGRAVTSMAALLGGNTPAMGQVKQVLASNFQRAFADQRDRTSSR